MNALPDIHHVTVQNPRVATTGAVGGLRGGEVYHHREVAQQLRVGPLEVVIWTGEIVPQEKPKIEVAPVNGVPIGILSHH